MTKQTGHGGGLISYLVNDGPSNTRALPSAFSAWGNLPSGAKGNIVFGSYSLATIEAATGVAVGLETTARNNSGLSPDTNLPPNLAVGTTRVAPIGENLTCGGTANCSIGLNITSEGGSNRVFNTGIYLQKFARYGMVVDANDGATAIVARAGSNAVSLHLQNIGTYKGSSTVADYQDSSNVTRFALKQDGSIKIAGELIAGQPVVLPSYTVAALPSCTDALRGAMAFVTDANTPTYNGPLIGGGSSAVPVACNGRGWSAH